MKKIFLTMLALLTLVSACQENASSLQVLNQDAIMVTIEDFDDSKTFMDQDRNIRWAEDDQIVAFMQSSLGLKYQIQDSYVGKTYGYFYKVDSGTSDYIGGGMELDHNVVYYPYSDAVEIEMSEDEYVLNVHLPIEQTYAPGSFGNGTMPMVAVSEDNDMTFRNVCGGIRLQLMGTGRIAMIMIEGNAGEMLSGDARVTAYADGDKPRISMCSDAYTSVVLFCGPDGVQLDRRTPTDFMIALPPVNFHRGFVVRVLDTEGNEYTIESDEENIVRRSSVLVMPPVMLDDTEEKVNVRFSVAISTEADTKAISAAEHIDVVYYEVWNYDMSRRLYPAEDGALTNEAVVHGRATVDLSLASEKDYTIIFWAQNKDCGAYDVTDLQMVKVDYSVMSGVKNQDKFDAYYAVNRFSVYGEMEEFVHLKRPLAQLNFGTEETDVNLEAITRLSLTISNLATAFNTLEGYGEMVSDMPVTFVSDGPVSTTETLNMNGRRFGWLTMNYVFVPEDMSMHDIETCFATQDRPDPARCTINNVPMRKNYRTNIVGRHFTDVESFVICVDQSYSNPSDEIMPYSVH